MSESLSDSCACTCGKPYCAGNRLAHGREWTYRRGCRCEECCQAERARMQALRTRLNTATQATAVKSGQQWTSAEMEVVLRADLTVMEVARLIGRTRSAVSKRRWMCRHDPKWVAAVGASSADDCVAAS